MAKPILQEEIKDKTIDMRDISTYIYLFYPQTKQNSDLADKLYFENILKAKVDKDGNKVYPDLETVIVSRVAEFEDGKKLEELVADIPDEDKTAISQLLKVGIRVTWVQQCKAELKKAIKEDREPNYLKYPL